VTRQTWTALVSALAFICLAVLLVVVPVPFVSWTPGGTRDTLGSVDNEPMIKVQGIDTYPTTGRLDMTVVAITPADTRCSNAMELSSVPNGGVPSIALPAHSGP
jgi:Lon-like protease